VFKVNWNEIDFMTKDLSKMQPYNIPIIVFNYDEESLDLQNNRKIVSKDMFFTTIELNTKLNITNLEPQRYHKRYVVIDKSKSMDIKEFMKNYHTLIVKTYNLQKTKA